ncbi:MAG: Cof subfamily protein (haloacid dehalogenase superfamily) [Saprospiraceae bacterium]|jgi:Cof subfamily protein (haloacid dehalogenase superfamily)
MPLKIAFTDIDGTLLNKDREVSELLKSEIKRITAKNIPFILISSRMPSAMTHIQKDLQIEGLPLICFNGGLVLVDGKTIHSCAIPVETISVIADLNSNNKFHISLYNTNDWYVEEMDYWANREVTNTKVKPTVKPISEVIKNWTVSNKGAHKIMCMGENKAINELENALKERFPEELHLYRSKDTYLEIANKEISKLTGIKTLLTHKYPTLNLENCIAFGDNYNDMEMLKAVQIGVAVANAKEAVLAVADEVVETNKKDGVAKGIAKYFPLSNGKKSTIQLKENNK